MHWLLFKKVFSLNQNQSESYKIKIFDQSLSYIIKYTDPQPDVKNFFALETYLICYCIYHQFLIDGQKIIQERIDKKVVMNSIKSICLKLRYADEQDIEKKNSMHYE